MRAAVAKRRGRRASAAAVVLPLAAVGTPGAFFSAHTVNTSLQQVTLPAGIVAGEGLFVWGTHNILGAVQTVSIGAGSTAGWKILSQGSLSSGFVVFTWFVAWKPSAVGGAAANDALFIQSTGSQEWSLLCQRIQGHKAATDPELSSWLINNASEVTTHSPAAFTPTGGVKKRLWAALMAANGSQNVNSYPAGYTLTAFQKGASFNGDTVAFGFLANEAASEDPGNFVLAVARGAVLGVASWESAS